MEEARIPEQRQKRAYRHVLDGITNSVSVYYDEIPFRVCSKTVTIRSPNMQENSRGLVQMALFPVECLVGEAVSKRVYFLSDGLKISIQYMSALVDEVLQTQT